MSNKIHFVKCPGPECCKELWRCNRPFMRSQLWYQKLLPEHSLFCKMCIHIWNIVLSSPCTIEDYVQILLANYLVFFSCVNKSDWLLKIPACQVKLVFSYIFEVKMELSTKSLWYVLWLNEAQEQETHCMMYGLNDSEILLGS